MGSVIGREVSMSGGGFAAQDCLEAKLAHCESQSFLVEWQHRRVILAPSLTILVDDSWDSSQWDSDGLQECASP